MTVIDESAPESPPAPPAPGIEPAAKRVLLVWDAPNLDMGLGAILGGRPTAAHRPRFDALGRWLLARTAELAAGYPQLTIEPEATASLHPGEMARLGLEPGQRLTGQQTAENLGADSVGAA